MEFTKPAPKVNVNDMRGRLIASRKDQAAFGLRDGAAEFLGGLDPLLDDNLDVFERLAACLPIGGAAGEFGHLGDERIVHCAPVDYDLVLRSQFLLPTCTLG